MSFMDKGGNKTKCYDIDKVDNLINAVLTSCDNLMKAVVQVVDFDNDVKNVPKDTEQRQQIISEPVQDEVPSPSYDQIRSKIYSETPFSPVAQAKEKKNLISKIKIAMSEKKPSTSAWASSSKTKDTRKIKSTSSKRAAKNIDEKPKNKKSTPTRAVNSSSSKSRSGTSELSDQKLKFKTGTTRIGPGISIRSGTGSGEGKRSYQPGEARRAGEREKPAAVDVQKDDKNALARSRQKATLPDFVESPEKLLRSDGKSGKDPAKIQTRANSPSKHISTMDKNAMKKGIKQKDKLKSKTSAKKAKSSPSGKKVPTKKTNKSGGLITWCCPNKKENKKLQTDPKSKAKNISTKKSKTGQVTKKLPHLRKEPKRASKSASKSKSKSKTKKSKTKKLASTKSQSKSKSTQQNKPENKESELSQKSVGESEKFHQKSCISTKTLKSTDNTSASMSKTWSSGKTGTEAMKKVESTTTSAQSTKSTTSFTEIDNRAKIPNEISLLEIYGSSNSGCVDLEQRTSSSQDNSNPRRLIAEMALEIQNHHSMMQTPNADGTTNSPESLTNAECTCPPQAATRENSCPKIEQNSFPTSNQRGSAIVKDDHTNCTSKHCLHRNDDDPFSEIKIIYRPPILNLKSHSSKSSNLVSSSSLENQSNRKPPGSSKPKSGPPVHWSGNVDSKLQSSGNKDNAQQFPVSRQYVKKPMPESIPPSSTTISSASDSSLHQRKSNHSVQSNPEFYISRSPSGSKIIYDYANEKASSSVRDAVQSCSHIPKRNLGCPKKISSDTILPTQEKPNCVEQSKLSKVPPSKTSKINNKPSAAVQRTPSFNFHEHSLEMKNNFRNFIVPYVEKQAFYDEKIANLKLTLSQEKLFAAKEQSTRPEASHKRTPSKNPSVGLPISDFCNILEPETDGNVSTKFLDTPEFQVSNTISRETPFKFYISTTVDINEKPALNIPSKCHNYEYTVDTFPKDGPPTNPALVVKMKKCEGDRGE